MVRIHRYTAGLLFLILGLIALWPGLTGKAIGPWDQISPMATGTTAESTVPWDVLQADGCLQFYVWRDLVLDSWGHGKVPFWNPYELAGTPLLANSQSEALYPPNIILGLLHVPTTWAVWLLALGHLVLAGMGTYAMVRVLGGSAAGALLAGCSIVASPFFLGWTALASVPATCAWMTVYWAARLNLVSNSALGRNLGAKVSAVGLAAGMMILAGHLQFVAYALLFGEILAVGMALVEKRPKAILMGWVGLALGVCLAAPQLLPVLANTKNSHRQNVPTADGYKAYTSLSMKAFELGNIFFPTASGNPRDYLALNDKQRVQGYWPALAKPGGNFAESALFLGPFSLALLLLLDFRNKRNWILLGVGLVSVLLAFGTPLNQLLYFGVPGWSASGSPARVAVVAVIAFAVLAGLAVPSEAIEKAKSKAFLGLIALLCVAGLGLAFSPIGKPENVQAGWVAQAALAAAPFMLLGTIACLASGYLLTSEKGFKYKECVALVPVIVALPYLTQLVPFGKLPAKVVGPKFERVAIVNDKWSLFAVPNAVMPPNLASLNRIHELGGYDSLLHNDTVGILNSAYGDPFPPENGNMAFVKSGATDAALATLGVSERWSGVDHVPVDGARASVDGKKVAIESEDLQGLTLRAPAGKLTVLDRNDGNWRATVNGVAVEVPPGLWLELPLKDEKNRVILSYQPPRYGLGLGLAGIALLLMAISIFLGRSKRDPGERNGFSGELGPVA